jgi:Mn2+/Fe2+ NRAMP family transporter
MRGIAPGIIAGAADLDPAAVLTATLVGATFGLAVGWVTLLCVPILQSFFHSSARIGQETGKGLVRVLRERFGRKAAFALAAMVVTVNIAMIVADLAAVSEALSSLTRQPPYYFPAVIAFVVWAVLAMGHYKHAARALGWLSLFLFAYIGAAVVVTDSFQMLAREIFIPRIPSRPDYAIAVVAVFGSLLTPDIIIWQSSSRRDLGGAHHDSEARVGCTIASMISLSVIICASAMSDVDPDALTTSQAAGALQRFGEAGPVLFALGIVGSGLVALPILVASMCFSIAEAAGWEASLNKEPWKAPGFFILISAVLLVAVTANLIGFNTVRVLYYSQVLAGIFVIPLMLYVIRLSNDVSIVSRRNTFWQNFWLGGAAGGMLVANAAAIWLWLAR